MIQSKVGEISPSRKRCSLKMEKGKARKERKNEKKGSLASVFQRFSRAVELVVRE
jgi:hypothetical protein